LAATWAATALFQLRNIEPNGAIARVRTASTPPISCSTASAFSFAKEIEMKTLIARITLVRRFRMAAALAAAAMLTVVPAAGAATLVPTSTEIDYMLGLKAGPDSYAPREPSVFAKAPGFTAGPYDPHGPRLDTRARAE
jgi:hypothetical protein